MVFWLKGEFHIVIRENLLSEIKMRLYRIVTLVIHMEVLHVLEFLCAGRFGCAVVAVSVVDEYRRHWGVHVVVVIGRPCPPVVT